MKYYTISFPGRWGQHVDEIWSEDQIIESYYKYWYSKMVQVNRHDLISRELCIDDWCVLHWAVEIPKPDWITE